MGTWGTGIFDNDVAADVRDYYLALIEKGSDQATDGVLRKWGPLANDNDADGMHIWLALAASQHQLGRLEDHVRDRAVTIIDSGADLDRWREDAPESVAAREKALRSLRAKLLGPQPSPRKARKRVPLKPRFEPGDIVAFRLDDGRSLLLRTVGHHRDETGDTVAIMELVDWMGAEIPDEQTIARMPARDVQPDWPPTFPTRPYGRSFWAPQIIGPSVRDRISVVGHFKPPPPPTEHSRRFRLLPRTEQGWQLASTGYLRWDSVPLYALHLFGEGPDPDA